MKIYQRSNKLKTILKNEDLHKNEDPLKKYVSNNLNCSSFFWKVTSLQVVSGELYFSFWSVATSFLNSQLQF